MFATNKIYIENDIITKEILSKYPKRKKTYALGNYYNIENNKLYFVHKTFQEYFACCFLVDSLKDLLNEYTNKNKNLEEAIKIIFNLLYCDNYLFKRIEHIFNNMFLNSELTTNKCYKEAFTEFVPYLYDYYLKNIFLNISVKNNILKSHNYLSSIHKLINLFNIDTFENVDEYIVSLILRNKHYVNMDINKLVLENADLSGAFLRGLFNECKFLRVNFSRCDLYNSIFNNVSIVNCQFSSVYGTKVNFNNSKLVNFKLKHSNMVEANFNKINFEESSIESVDFSYSTFNMCFFKNTKFIECDFSNASFLKINGSITFSKCRIFECEFLEATEDIYFENCYAANDLSHSENSNNEYI